MKSSSLQLLSLLFAWIAAVPAHAAPTCPDDETVEGIDVSKWQGSIDWDQVASDGVDFAFIRVNHGLEDIDERFDENWAGAASSGILRGAYQYFINREDPLAQAELFLERMGPLGPGDLPPVLDIEDSDDEDAGDALSPAELREAIWIWLDRVESELGVKPILYSYRYYWQTRIQTTEFEDAGYPFWFANIVPTCPDLPPNASRWDFWQRSWTGEVAGISGDVDLDVFNGGHAELAAFTAPSPVCGDGHCTGEEGPTICSADCVGCLSIGAAGRILDDTDACATFAGAPEGWRWNAPAGHGGSARWTYAYAGSEPDNYGNYALRFEVPGTYRISVFLDAGSQATSVQAPYRVRHAGQETSFVVDQSIVDGWHELAVLPFAAGGDQWVRLDDSTGEPFSQRRRLVFDAIHVEPVILETTDAGGLDDGGLSDSGIVDAGGDPLPDGGGLIDAGWEAGPGGGMTDHDAGNLGDASTSRDLPSSVVEGCACVTPLPGARAPGSWACGMVVGLCLLFGHRRARCSRRRGACTR